MSAKIVYSHDTTADKLILEAASALKSKSSFIIGFMYNKNRSWKQHFGPKKFIYYIKGIKRRHHRWLVRTLHGMKFMHSVGWEKAWINKGKREGDKIKIYKLRILLATILYCFSFQAKIKTLFYFCSRQQFVDCMKDTGCSKKCCFFHKYDFGLSTNGGFSVV